MTCSVPKCTAVASVLIEWGHGYGEDRQPFRDWLCQGCAAHMLGHEGPKQIEGPVLAARAPP